MNTSTSMTKAYATKEQPKAHSIARRSIPARLYLCALICALALLGAFTLATPQAAHAKDYFIDSVNIRANLKADGGMDVVENRTFNFDGDFSFVYWDFPLKNGQTIDFTSLSARSEDGQTMQFKQSDTQEVGTFSIEDDGETQRLTAYFNASDEKLTFDLAYTESNVVAAYSDNAQLYWQFIGRGWGVETKNVSIDIVPPTPLAKNQVRAWAHGPLNGAVAITEEGNVTLKVSDLPANTFVEARALYPVSAFPYASTVEGTISDKALQEEQAWADEANAYRNKTRLRYYGFSALGLFVALGLFIAVVIMFQKYGREYEQDIELNGKYWREDPRPDMPPAMIGCLWRFGEVTNDDISATLMDLTDRKVITMVEKREEVKRFFGAPKIEKSYTFKVNPELLAKERLINQDLVKLLIKTGWSDTEFSFDSIEAYAKKHAQSYLEAINAWKANVKGQVEIENLIETQSKTAQVIAFALAIIMALVAVLLFIAECTIAGIVAAVLCLPTLGMAFFMKRRSREGDELYHRYQGLNNYLKDFSRIDTAPPTSIVVWNRFLVLATVFGIAEEVAKNLEVALPDVVHADEFAMSYWWFYGPGLHMAPAKALNNTFAAASAAAVAQSAASSGAGLGGGFSGGGGFGGGGGGGGAG